MPDSGKMNYPGEEGHYSQNPPITNYPDSQFAPTIPFESGLPGSKVTGKPRKRRNGWQVATLVLFITTVIFGATTALLITHPRTVTVSTATTGNATTAPQPTPTVPTNPTPTSATDTNTTTPPSSTPVPSTSLTPVPDGVIQENITLTCSGCNDPIRVTINTVRVDSANGRMLWNNTFKDVTGTDVGYNINTYTLQDTTTQTSAIPAVFSQSSGNLVNNIPSTVQGIFTFVPSRNITYILTVVIYSYSGVTITFDPVKITF